MLFLVGTTGKYRSILMIGGGLVNMEPTDDSHSFPPSLSHADSQRAFRILDANLNRAYEAIRTLEDIARFHDLSTHQREYKTVRHSLRHATRTWNAPELWNSRDAEGDVGRTQKVPSEGDRSGGFPDIAAAASHRLQQALRCLEEIAKFQVPESAPELEKLRYQTYDLNASLLLALQRDLSFLRNARLYVLADCRPDLATFARRVCEISEQGAELIQIRDKSKDASEILQYAAAAHNAIDPLKTRIIINDRADLARLTNAFGLHVGQTDLTVSQARTLLSPQSIVGLSTHSIEQVRDALQRKADYIGCGPTFPSQTKSFDSFAGLDFLSQVAEEIDQTHLPSFAIGGINLANLPEVLNTGIARVVVGSAIWNGDEPGRITGEIRGKLG